MKQPKRICVFASGRGSNFEVLLKMIKRRRLRAVISLLVSNNPGAGALETARQERIQVKVIQHDGNSPELLPLLESNCIELIVLAGYLRKIPDEVVSRYSNRIINIHPALLPSFGGKGFYGLKVHEAVLAAGVTITGATVHFVNEQYDSGPIIMQSAVKVKPKDDAKSLQRRVLRTEHDILWRAVKLAAEDRIRVDGQRVIRKG